MDDNVFLKLLEHAWVVILGIAGFIMRGIISDVKDVKKEQGDCELRLEKFKTHVSDTYSKEVNTQASLNRIHSRIDDMSTDIKEILRQVK